jgi:hypothetical protein
MQETSETGNRDVLQMVAQTDTQGQPSDAEIFDAATHFGGRPPQERPWSMRTSGTFEPRTADLAKMTADSAFVCGGSKFWDVRSMST